MVVRVAGLAYQKGFGGHFHNDNAVGVLRDIPGLVVAVAGAARRRGADAAHLPRGGARSTAASASSSSRSRCTTRATCTRTATAAGSRRTPPADGRVTSRSAGRASTATARDLTIVTFGNGLRMSLRVARRLAGRVGAGVVDLRWLAPLPVDDILREAGATGRVLVVDETRRTGGVSEGVLAALVDAGFDGRVARVASKDSFIPLGDAANLVLLSEAEIEAAALALVSGEAARRPARRAPRRGR